MTTLESLLKSPAHNTFRRAAIKRRNTSNGKYESSWTDITTFVKAWGSFESSIDAVRLNRFTHSGLDLLVRNDTGAFNPESDANSLWFGTLSRYRTLVRIQAGYKDASENEYPTETTQGIYIMSEEVPRSSRTNDAYIKCKSLVSVFDEVMADEVAGLGSTQTASELVARIRDHTDGSSNFVFREFITSTAWSIQTTTTFYNLATTTSELENMTCWELMTKLAECEGYIVLVNRTGGIEFRDRSARTTTVAFAFRGQGYNHPSIVSLDESKDALDKYYNRFRLRWTDADTSTSYVEAGVATTVDPSSSAWKFGSRLYSFSNEFFQTSTVAQTVVNHLLTTFSDVKEEIRITTKFMPQIEVSDRVSVSYRSYDITSQTLWDSFDWDNANWSVEDGENFDYDAVEFKVLSKRTDLERFTTEFSLRRV